MHSNEVSGHGAVLTNFQVAPLAPGDGDAPGGTDADGEPDAAGEPEGAVEADGTADPEALDGAAEADAAADPDGAGSWPGRSVNPGVEPHAATSPTSSVSAIDPRAAREPWNGVTGTGRSVAADRTPDQSVVSQRRSSIAVAHRLGGHLEVGVEASRHGRRRGQSGDRLAHVTQPCVALRRSDGERRVAHPQPGMASLERVCRRSAPVLGEEQGQPVTSLGQPGVDLGIERTKLGVAGHAVIEPADQRLEERHATGRVVQARLGLTARLGQRARCQDLPSVWTAGA